MVWTGYNVPRSDEKMSVGDDQSTTGGLLVVMAVAPLQPATVGMMKGGEGSLSFS